MDMLLILQVLSYDPSFWVECSLLVLSISYLGLRLISAKLDNRSCMVFQSETLYRGIRKAPEQTLSKFRSINKKLKVGALISVKEVA